MASPGLFGFDVIVAINCSRFYKINLPEYKSCNSSLCLLFDFAAPFFFDFFDFCVCLHGTEANKFVRRRSFAAASCVLFIVNII